MLQVRFGLARETVDHEVCHRKVVLSLGGGGGAGYGYAGVFRLLARHGLDPHLICGTSIGALSAIFRARRHHHDPSPIFVLLRQLSWQKVFNFGPEPSRYGLPATLRLHLRRAVGKYFRNQDGDVLTMGELSVPTHIVTTGLTVDAMKHELSYYEHFLDDLVRPGVVFRANRLGRLRKLASITRELMSDPAALKQVVFGYDPLTMDADCVDAAGFSSAVPGLLHYDILRDDPRMKTLMDNLYAEHGITRLTEGGLIQNVPSRIGYKSVMGGTLGGHRNAYVLAVDCFAPKPRALLFYPVQQLVRGNVTRAAQFANSYVPLSRTLSPMNLVPSIKDLSRASGWAEEDLEPHVPLMAATCAPFEAI
jgi:predicted acylesterase/phospholipase RssA